MCQDVPGEVVAVLEATEPPFTTCFRQKRRVSDVLQEVECLISGDYDYVVFLCVFNHILQQNQLCFGIGPIHLWGHKHGVQDKVDGTTGSHVASHTPQLAANVISGSPQFEPSEPQNQWAVDSKTVLKLRKTSPT